MTHSLKVLVLTGTCGSGKSTIARLLGSRAGWCRVSEDDIWPRRFGKNRGPFGTAEHRQKRQVVHREVLECVHSARRDGLNVVIDATVHEAPPEALEEYRAMFAGAEIAWHLCVLHPRVEVAIARDVGRESGSLGALRVAALHSKFNGRAIPAECFIDTSVESPEVTAARVVDLLANNSLQPTAVRAPADAGRFRQSAQAQPAGTGPNRPRMGTP
jgi:predicted kinase